MTDAVAIAIVGAGGTTIASVVAAYFSYKSKAIAKETHAIVNSRMTELLALAKSASKAEGVIEGKADEKANQLAKPG